MATNTVRIQATVDKDVNDIVSKKLKSIGMNYSSIFNLFLHQFKDMDPVDILNEVARMASVNSLNKTLTNALDTGKIPEKKMTPKQLKEMWDNDDEW